ncbi:hypothetical protein BJY16_008143 [Actinoplanes octamycinicus]|uniref:Uncharacterized protein n=1 Tax=Actinoplanes octamycinicus TaxID=135948 RepID=A0A7W7H6A2_9ACTN|nr:hypothetical protein [Actinoplanes octamycinicus]MBB4744684.1 hypothetical protein [Actinoplanes octamycinicus]
MKRFWADRSASLKSMAAIVVADAITRSRLGEVARTATAPVGGFRH